ncbi:MAG: hypothetical protein C0456_18765 [Hyphomonas sp.]|uniref:DUF5681 domain-containing protein n=1 Tax=Hyphomonas sp. TaxID=87 RepID=UPI001D2DDCB7|nr:DUF5681 domain-containing protein [Hyphomonas sp.]MBA4228652.1 hypothetical protein [Hyphomonas sp.]
MAANRDDDDGAVGYGRPPRAARFKRGQSGNPAGRPRKDRGQSAIAARVLGETQRLAGQPKGARVRFKTLEIVVMTMKQMAIAGQNAAATLYTSYMERYSRPAPPEHPVGYLVVPEVLTEEEWEARYTPKDDPPDEPEAAE